MTSQKTDSNEYLVYLQQGNARSETAELEVTKQPRVEFLTPKITRVF